MTRVLRELLAVERRRRRQSVAIASACAAIAGAAAVILLGLSGWFLSAAAGAGLAGPAAAHAFNYLLPSAAIRLLAIARTGARYGERLMGHEAALLTLAPVRPALFAAIASDAPERSLAVTKGDAATALAQDVGTLEGWLVRRASLWGAAAAVVAGLTLIMRVGWAPMLSTAACLTLATCGTLALQRYLRTSSLAIRMATQALKEELALLAAARVELRCYALESWAQRRIDHLADALTQAQRQHADRLSSFETWQAGALGLAVASALWLARGEGAPMTALAALAAAMAVEGIGPLNRHLLQRAGVDEAKKRLGSHLGRASGGAPALSEAFVVDASAECTVVWHRPSDPTVRRPSKVELQAGSRFALVGPSGSGKTRFVETLMGLREASPGKLFIGGHDIATIAPTCLRASFAWLPQDASLLAGTVRDNLALVGDKVDELSMWRALRFARLDALVRGLPDGLDAWVGEDGARLSGGERRRLGLARALLSEAPWLLLDEPTEGLDAGLEAQVLEGLTQRLRATGQGLIVVTHRPAVMAFCNHTLRFGAGTTAAFPDHAGTGPEVRSRS